MYCTNCGKKLTGTETFCPHCGARQAPPPAPSEPAADPQAQQSPAVPDAQPLTGSRPSHPAPARRGKRWLLLGLAGVVLLLLAINTVLANRTLSLPDPAAFFGLTWETMPYGGSYDYSYDETAPSAMDADTALAAMTAYTAQLNAQGIDALVTQKDTQNRIEIAVDLGAASLLDRSRQKVWLDYYLPEQRFFLSLPYGQSLQTIDFTPITAYAWAAPDLAQAEPPASQAAAKPDPVPDPEPAPVQPPAQTDATVPDFQAFCGNTLHVHEITEYSDYTEYVYFWKYNGKAMQEYLSLLQNTYHFQLRAKYTISSIDSYRYAFDYTGAGSPGTYDEDGMETDADGEDIALYLWDLAGEVHICLADGFTYQDTGDRTTRKITPYDSGKTSSSSSNSSSVPPARSSPDVLDCLTCGGDGDCPKCNGYGTMRVYGGSGDSYEATCSRCYGNRKCPTCGGSGKR